MTGTIRSLNRHLVLQEAKDESGNVVQSEFPDQPDLVEGRNPDLLPYVFNFKAPPSAHELNLVLAVTQSRIVEFMAKPEQTRLDQQH